MTTQRTFLLALALLLLALVTSPGTMAAAGARAANRATVCDRVAERGEGPRRFVNRLRRGQTGCFKRGVYRAPPGGIKLERPRVTLMSHPGHRATLAGRLWISRGARGATIRRLDLDGANPRHLPSPTVNADDVAFRRNVVTNNHTGICFAIGDDDYGRASKTIISRNRIHDCGALPATNHHHGIYVAHADGTVIRNNIIYRNADRGIQLYPDADGSLITGNVIDGNGEGVIFGGGSHTSSDNNIVKRNAITNSTERFNVESHWRGPVGIGNVVARNCLFGGARRPDEGGIEYPSVGFALFGNVVADPLYADPAAEDFSLDRRSPCAELLGRRRS